MDNMDPLQKAVPPQVWLIPIPIYELELALVLADSTAGFVKHAKEYFGHTYTDDSFGGAASLYKRTKFATYLLRDKLNHRTIAHELFHNTVRMLHYCDVQFDLANHEAFAYLNDYLHEQVYAKLAEQ